MSEFKDKAKELCDKSPCHHKCHDTKDCVVEDEAREYLHSALTNEAKVSEKDKLLLINENKSNNSDFKSNNFEVKNNEELFKQALVGGMNRRFDKDLMKLDLCDSIVWKELDDGATALDIDRTTENLYSIGYRKQSEIIEQYRQKVNTKMGKHTHLLGKEYVQRILREVAKEMKGGE